MRLAQLCAHPQTMRCIKCVPYFCTFFTHTVWVPDLCMLAGWIVPRGPWPSLGSPSLHPLPPSPLWADSLAPRPPRPGKAGPFKDPVEAATDP